MPTVVTVGTFDGVHAGHRRLFEKVREIASGHRGGAAGVAVTFRRQPRAFLQPDVPVTYLCTLDERLRLLTSAGIDFVIPVDFDDALRSMTARDFMTCLREQLEMRDFVVGPGAAIGRDRKGDLPALTALGRDLGFRTHSVEPACIAGVPVSSTAIRRALGKGEVSTVSAMLGRDFGLRGRVAPGDRRGRELGFPTANLVASDQDLPAALPADGIYATWAQLEDGRRRMAATSIGVRPTFGGGHRTVEAYLIDFAGNLYGQTLELKFVSWLRGERKFNSADSLAAEMKRDVAAIREILGGRPAGRAAGLRVDSP